MLNAVSPWPNFTQEEAGAVSRVLLSNRVNAWTGEEVRFFEAEFARFSNTKHAIALANGTLALDLALHGLRIGSVNGGSADDEVVVTPRTFIASASCVINAGAVPVFADVGRESGNIEPDTVAAVLTPKTRAVIAVHLAGWPCDMDGLRDVTKTSDIKLIEDCAQAHGALYKGRPVGSLGDVSAWSFCQDKIMTTGGEGGMVTCDDEDLWRRMWAFKDHGKSYEAVFEREHPPGFRWVHESIGTNWRMTEMQAVIGRIQLKRMPRWQAERAANALALDALIAPWTGPNGPLRLPKPSCEGCDGGCKGPSACRDAHYKRYVFVRPETTNLTREEIGHRFCDAGFTCMQGSCSEVYLERAFDDAPGRPAEPLPVAKNLGDTSLMFLVHPGMTYPQRAPDLS